MLSLETPQAKINKLLKNTYRFYNLSLSFKTYLEIGIRVNQVNVDFANLVPRLLSMFTETTDD